MAYFLYGKPRQRLLEDAEIVRLYVEEGLSSDDVGLRAGCTGNTVLVLVRKAGGTVRRRGKGPTGRQKHYRALVD